MTDEWPPRMTITPRGAANMFLLAHAKDATPLAVEKLEELLKMFFDAGRNYEREQIAQWLEGRSLLGDLAKELARECRTLEPGE